MSKSTLFLGVLCIGLIIFSQSITAQQSNIAIQQNNQGQFLTINEKPFIVNGMNWDYFPIGTNFNYSLWTQSDDVIKSALSTEMSMLKNMGVNTIRQYTGVPKKWITYIYEQYGIYTMLNHSFGRYGLTIDGEWVANTEYADPRVKDLLFKEISMMTEEYKNTPGLLLFLLGNENNYGLFWEGAETENIPIEDRKSTGRAEALYKLFNEGVKTMKTIDRSHPIAICNGDLLFLDLIKKYCPDVDILGINIYRGASFGDAFERVKNEYGKPVILTEFGADAFNAKENAEDQQAQAYYMVQNWKEIYQNTAGMGKANNSLGGFTFQFSDGWWKYGQTSGLDVHDNNASWSNGGYLIDYQEGENNMNEEWFGICAKGQTNERGIYQLFPRAAYYALQEVHRLDPYTSNTTLGSIESYFAGVSITDALIKARGDKAALASDETNKIRLSRLTAELTTFNTGGSLISTPNEAVVGGDKYPNQLGFDHMQSFYVGVSGNPAPNMRANVEFNILGNVAQNPINEVFYENRGRTITVNTNNGPVNIGDGNRLQVYRADFSWNQKYADVKGFYRTGHYHWGYEGDFFGLYPEANYGPNIDIYNGNAPLGVEVYGKKGLKGLTIAMGPELWWGANPAALLKYHKKIFGLDMTGIFHEDFEQRANTESSFAIPQPKTRRATLHAKTKIGALGLELGGIWGGQPLVGRSFQLMNTDLSDKEVYQDQINENDTWGGKVKLTYSKGRINWYAQAAAMSLVANGGADYTKTFTGWRLKDSGSGNQYNFLSGLTYTVGSLQIAPNFLWQRPIQGPIPNDVGSPGRARNILADPFVVRSNRKTTGGELLLTFDPTPATWMYDWDSDRTEDAKFAMSTGFVFRDQTTNQDGGIGILPNGRTTFAFTSSAPAAFLWEAYSRIISKLSPDLGFIANIYTGNAQANGSDQRLIHRTGADLRMIFKKVKLTTKAQFNDWGPYDYHRDFNLTYPQQYMLDVSTFLGKSQWLDLPNTKIGIQGLFRTLNQFSPRYCPTHSIDGSGASICDPTAIGYNNGREWEIRTYVHINIFQ